MKPIIDPAESIEPIEQTDPTDHHERNRAPTNTRKIRQEMNRHLLGLVLFVLVIVGGGLIGLTYGWSAAVLGVLCLATGAGMIGFLWWLFTALGKWAGGD